MRRIRVAQIGTSRYSHGNYIFESMIRQPEFFEIVGYSMPEGEKEKFPERTALFKNYAELTVDEILNDSQIEAVTVETEEEYLTKYALLAAQYGKRIHMEKPGGQNLADFEKMISIQKRNGKVFQSGYMYRYNPFVKDLIRRVKENELGQSISVEAQMNCLHDNNSRAWFNNFNGSMMFFLGCHLIDLVLQIQGTPDNIIPLNKNTNIDGINFTDFCMAVLEYKNGVSFVKASAVEAGGFYRRHLTANGSKGSIEIRPLEMFTSVPDALRSGKTEYTDMSAGWDYQGKYSESDCYDRYDDMMHAFAQMIAGKLINPQTYDYELELYKTILKCCGGKI